MPNSRSNAFSAAWMSGNVIVECPTRSHGRSGCAGLATGGDCHNAAPAARFGFRLEDVPRPCTKSPLSNGTEAEDMRRFAQRSGSGARPRVALLIETSLASGRDILRGISGYLRSHEPWALFHEAHGLEEGVPGWLRSWNGDGIIARIQSSEMAHALLETGLPVVDVLGVVPNL